MKQLLLSIIFTTAFANRGVINKLNDVDYARMPPLYHMDAFESCFQQSRDKYCTVTFGLTSDKPNGLLSMINEYSKQRKTHFNHSNLRYGLCVTERCVHHYGKNVTKSAELIFEECINELFIEKYDLKAMVVKYHCNEFQVNNENLDIGDICVALTIIALVSIAIIATITDSCMLNGNTKAYHMLLNFSLKRNWFNLKSTKINESDQTEKLFKSLHGLKVFLFFMVVLAHSSVAVLLTVKDVKFIEESYNNLFSYIIFTGTTIIQAFFVISGMLLVYKFQLHEERNRIDYNLVPNILALRWLRLTPPYALVIAMTLTWFRHIKFGPLWEIATGVEIIDCRHRGLLNLFYLNNYIYDSQCLPHTWYLAADTQLFVIGVFIYLIARDTKLRAFVLGLAFFVGIIIPVIHTYLQDLEPLLILSPESIKTFFGNDPTYNEVYKRGHTNITSYVVGLALGYLIYSLKRKNFTIEKYKKYRFIYWSLLPACLSLMMLGSIFYNDAPSPSMCARLLYAATANPLFAVMVAIFILGMAFKYEDIYRNFFEWSNWLPLSRLSYNAFVVHFVIIRLYIGTVTELMEDSPLKIVLLILCFIMASFLAAVPLWLFVEAPIANCVKFYTSTNVERKIRTDYNQKKISTKINKHKSKIN